MYPPANGCSMLEAFSIEPFSQGNIINNFDGFGKQTYGAVEHLNDPLVQPNINQPNMGEQQSIQVGEQPNIRQQQPSIVREQSQIDRQQRPSIVNELPKIDGLQQITIGGKQSKTGERNSNHPRPPKHNPIVHRDIHIINNRPSHMHRQQPLRRHHSRPITSNTYINTKRNRKESNNNNLLWIIIGILIFFNILLSIMYVKKN